MSLLAQPIGGGCCPVNKMEITDQKKSSEQEKFTSAKKLERLSCFQNHLCPTDVHADCRFPIDPQSRLLWKSQSQVVGHFYYKLLKNLFKGQVRMSLLLSLCRICFLATTLQTPCPKLFLSNIKTDLDWRLYTLDKMGSMTKGLHPLLGLLGTVAPVLYSCPGPSLS